MTQAIALESDVLLNWLFVTLCMHVTPIETECREASYLSFIWSHPRSSFYSDQLCGLYYLYYYFWLFCTSWKQH